MKHKGDEINERWEGRIRGIKKEVQKNMAHNLEMEGKIDEEFKEQKEQMERIIASQRRSEEWQRKMEEWMEQIKPEQGKESEHSEYHRSVSHSLHALGSISINLPD